MGKRSDFKRIEKDLYETPFEAVEPLVPHLPRNCTFCEPCAGHLKLVDHLRWFGHECVSTIDIVSREPGIVEKDATTLIESDLNGADFIITNPPWSRPLLHPMIERFCDLRPTWLLFDADWSHTRQASTLMKRCHKIVSIGRVKWIEGSKMTGKDNCAWYLFDKHEGDTIFIPRA